ncbi:MAG: winged helix-turn-helix domain-containing protein [Pseudomonadota bacterium]|nr:winged helix-turn-helix domain-containing protein [Pseudomonadota bacterium]
MSLATNEEVSGKLTKDRFLLVGRNPGFSRSVAEVMERYRVCEIIEACSLDGAARLLSGEQFALILLDLPASDLCGSACSSFGQLLGESTPVVVFIDPNVGPVLTIQVGFLPNEYLIKPFRFGSLLDRVNTLLPYDPTTGQESYDIGSATFVPRKSLLNNSSMGASIRLTEKETVLLEMLYHAGKRSVSRESLLKEGWGYQASIPTRTLETHIYRLRKKLREANGSGEILVKTAQGYRLKLDSSAD